MPLTAVQKLKSYDIKPTRKEFLLADDSSVTPLGKLKNQPCMIGDRFVAIDFYVLETSYADEDDGIEQIILGRTFLKTAGALIDCNDDTITLRNLGSPNIVFKMKKEDEFVCQHSGNTKKKSLAVITRSKPRMRVIKNAEGKISINRDTSRSTPAMVERLESPEAKRRAISMPFLSPCYEGIQSTSTWIRPEHIEHINPFYSKTIRILEGQFKYDVEEFIKECKEIWPFMEQCGMELELQELVPYLLKEKMTAEEFCNHLSKTCDDKINKSIPKKLNDPGRPEISCMIGCTWFEKVLCDTGAGVNLMPLSVANALKFEKLLNKQILLKFADGTYRLTEGMLENVPLRTNGQFFAVDFHVMRFDVEPEDLLVLGRPFLHTAQAEIDCHTGEVKFRARERDEAEKIKMNGNRPPGFEHALPKGTFIPIQRHMRHKSTQRHVFSASLESEQVKKVKQDEVIDLTEDENEDTIMEDKAKEENSVLDSDEGSG